MEKEAYIKKLKTKMNEWSEEINELALRAGKEKKEKRFEYQELMDGLRAQREDLDRRITEMQKADESSWEERKSGVESSWKILKEKYVAAKSRFQENIEKEMYK